MSKTAKEILMFKSKPLGGGNEEVHQVIIRSNHPDTKIGIYGNDFHYVNRPSANCQLASIRKAQNLDVLNKEEFIAFVDAARKGNIEGFRKTSLLLDVYARLRPSLVAKFKAAGARMLMTKKYINNTGSEMCIMIADITQR